MSLPNSKITKAQKHELKDWKQGLPKGSTIANDGLCLTVVCIPDGAVTRMVSSVCADSEQKFRRKVGEYMALSRWYYDGSTVVLPGFCYATDVVEGLAGTGTATETFVKD